MSTLKEALTASEDNYSQRKAFTLFLYKYFIRLKWAVEKIRFRSGELDPEDEDILEPIYEHFLESERRRE